jgi:hypothetical protein
MWWAFVPFFDPAIQDEVLFYQQLNHRRQYSKGWFHQDDGDNGGKNLTVQSLLLWYYYLSAQTMQGQ